MKNYDVTFVLPGGALIPPPAGGVDVVFRLAHALNKSGIKTSIIFCPRPLINMDENLGRLPIYMELFAKIFKGQRIGLLVHHLNLISSLLWKQDYDYDILNGIDTFIARKAGEVNLGTRIIFATYWSTAYFVRQFTDIVPSVPFYLIQHWEGDPSFSVNLSTYANETYEFDFNKVVTNRKVLEMFKNDSPLFFNVGIDTKFYQMITPLEGREKSVLIPFRRNESKGLIYAIECVEKLLSFDSTIKIIAFGDLPAREIPGKIADRLEYYRYPTRKQLRNLYNRAKVFVLPSLVEGMSLVALEAMACGSAVVSTDNGGVNEYIENGVNGLICPVKNAKCLFEKVIFLLSHDHERNRMIECGLKTVEIFSNSKMEESFTKIVQDYLANTH